MRTPRKHITPSFVIALIALFVAMGGTGYAALKVTGKNVAAASECGKRRAALPTVLALREFGLQADVNLGEKDDGSDHLSSDVSEDGAQLEVMTAEEGGGINAITTNLSRPYRCVFPLVA